jgi:copper resistance protein B
MPLYTKTLLVVLCSLFLSAAALGAESSVMDPVYRGYPSDYHGFSENSTNQDVPTYAQDGQEGAQKNFRTQFVHDNEVFAVFFGDRLEYQTREGKDLLLWDVQAWVGEDYNKLWVKSEGTWSIHEEGFDEAEVELFYSRTIASFWDLQMGVRHDFKPDSDRTFAALGIEGLAPLWFELEATAYVSEDGDVSASLEVEYDLLITQRLIFQPRLETSIAVQEVQKYGIGGGFNHIELGARLRYEIRREFAPYLGLSWHRKLGATADFAREDGEDPDVLSFVAGLKIWF